MAAQPFHKTSPHVAGAEPGGAESDGYSGGTLDCDTDLAYGPSRSAGIVEAIHVVFIDGLPVRFYASPSGAADDPPWVALPDLHRAMGQPLQDLAAWEGPLGEGEDSRTIFSPEGPTQIISHVIASSFTARLVSWRRAPLSLAHQYGVGFSAAADVLLARLPPSEASSRKQKWLSESFDFGNAPRQPSGGKLSWGALRFSDGA